MSKSKAPKIIVEFSDSDSEELYGEGNYNKNRTIEDTITDSKTDVSDQNENDPGMDGTLVISSDDDDDVPISSRRSMVKAIPRTDSSSPPPILPSEDTPSSPKKSKTTTKKPSTYTPQLFNGLESKTQEARDSFIELPECSYLGKPNIGSSGQVEAMTCDCREQLVGNHNLACGEDSNCINRMTSIECTNDNCSCGDNCRNQRFQSKEYANIDVIQTELKGYGVRALENIPQNTFIYEYIGEVIDEPKFLQRMQSYKDEGIRHFYFMMLQKGEFIDATKRGSLARFCNHSCRPNCYVDKWIVGDKVKMGIFSQRDIIKGEEITFDYNVDRYGTQAQACYCGESNCIGILGGKTQTEAAATKLPQLIVDVLDLNRQDEKHWLSIAKKFTKDLKSASTQPPVSDEELYQEYSLSLPAKPISEESVSKIMSTLLQGPEQWLVEKLVTRIYITDDTDVHGQVMRMHGYQVFSVILANTGSSDVVPIMILEILTRWPRLTKNKISSSKIESTVKGLADNSGSEKIKKLATSLLQEWSNLEMAYRIPRRERSQIKEDNSATVTPREERSQQSKPSVSRSARSDSQGYKDVRRNDRFDRRDWSDTRDRNKDRGKERDHDRDSYTSSPNNHLPLGWESALSPTGRIYYYNRELNLTSWELPKQDSPSSVPSTSTPKTDKILPDNEWEKAEFAAKTLQRNKLQEIIESAKQQQQQLVLQHQQQKINELQSIVDAVKKARSPDSHRSHSSSKSSTKKPSKPKSDETVEATLTRTFAKYVPNIVGRYEEEVGSHDNVKLFSKDIVKILVAKETKSGREIKNPKELTDEKKTKIKAFIKSYMKKAIAKVEEKKNKPKRLTDSNGGDDKRRRID